MVNRTSDRIRGLSVFMPLFLTIFSFLLIGRFIMAYLGLTMAVIAGLVFAAIIAAVAINISLNRLTPGNNLPLRSQVAKLRFHSERMAYLETHDLLTGLHNRVWLDRFLSDPVFSVNIVSTDRRSSGFSIVLVDINNLRMLNDNFGLETGNRCLNHLTNLLRDLTDRDHMLVRSGGDQFAIIIPDSSPAKISFFLSRLDQAVFQNSDYPLHISWSTASTDEADEFGVPVFSLAEDRLVTGKLLDRNSSHSASFSAIINIMHKWHKDTEEHMARMQNLAIALARKSSLPEKQYSELRLLARLHDIGKLVLSDSILLKSGPLSDEEWELVRQHPSIGAQIVEMIPNLRQLSPAILAHHERWDGMGYPNCLAGEQIPFPARIISLVDSWDAMTNDRPYRKALTFDQAFQEIKINSGKQFDPVLSKQFMDMLEQAQLESFQHRMAHLLESENVLAC